MFVSEREREGCRCVESRERKLCVLCEREREKCGVCERRERESVCGV